MTRCFAKVLEGKYPSLLETGFPIIPDYLVSPMQFSSKLINDFGTISIQKRQGRHYYSTLVHLILRKINDKC